MKKIIEKQEESLSFDSFSPKTKEVNGNFYNEIKTNESLDIIEFSPPEINSKYNLGKFTTIKNFLEGDDLFSEINMIKNLV